MRPRLFIGSSVENLDVANAIQENLEYDANVTVWNQGVFSLSSTTIDDLLNCLDNTDFGIFVFNPEDITNIRNKTFSTVRDNIIFELGLFIGKLEKSRVFYVIPRDDHDLHLPTDLIGLAPGKYDSNRNDNNLKAALGPFCNQVREILKTYTFENLSDLEGESKAARKIAVDKNEGWEYYLACQLLDDKLFEINKSYDELENDLVIQRMKSYSGDEFWKFFEDSVATHGNTLKLINSTFADLNNSFAKQSALAIKNAVDRIIQLCKEQVAWEFELNGIAPPEELEPAKKQMRGWTRSYIDQINNISSRTKETITKILNDEIDNRATITLTLEPTAELEGVVELFREYRLNNL